MSKIFVVSSSMRKGGNSDLLCDAFIKGATENDNEVAKLSLKTLDLQFCRGCLACQRTGKCVLNDGVNAILPEVSASDVLVFATPIYYYAVCGQMKTFLDRLNPLFPQNNKFRKVYLLATAADGEESAMDGAVKETEGWISCFPDVELAGVVCGVGVTGVGEIKGTSAERQAYELGKSVK